MANSENALTTTNAATPATELDALSIEQLTMEAKFYYVQMGQNAVEFGKRLIAIKKKLPHGEWLNWLKENFQLKERSAQTFMQIAARFSNTQTFGNLGYSQLIQMLALPEGTEEDFIAEKAAEGKPVENMTIKQEREEIKKYKAKIEQLEKQVNFILDQNNQLADVARTLRHNLDASKNEMLDVEEQNQKLQAENDQLTSINHTLRLENEAFKDQEPQIIETVKTITPPDYVATVQRAEDLQQQVDHLLEQQEDAQKTIADLQDQVLKAVSKQGEPKIEYVDNVPSDYAATKQELETLKAQQENLRVDMAISQNLNALGAAAKFLLDNQDRLTANLENFISADFTTDNIKQLAQLVTLLVNNVDGNFDI